MILLTGATGFVGRETLKQLRDKGYAVRALIRNPEVVSHHPDFQGVEIIEGDILDVLSLEKACEGVTEIIHCAATVSFRKVDRALMKKTNVTGTANVVNAGINAGVRKLIHVSSIAALGRSREHEAITEETRWKSDGKNSYYAQTKYAAEKEVYRGLAEGLPCVIACPGVILGYGDGKSGSAGIFKFAAKGLPFYPVGSNGFIGVKDVAKALIVLLEGNHNSGEKYILVSQSVTYQLLLSLIAKVLQKKPPVWMIPPFGAKLLGRIMETLSFITRTNPVFTTETMRTASHRYIYDGSLFSITFDFSYEPIERVVQDTAQSFLNTYANPGERR